MDEKITTAADPKLPTDDSAEAEIARLRAEVEALEEQVVRAESATSDTAGADVAKAPSRTWPRTAAATVLILVACLLAPLAVISTWANSQVSDTDRYVATVAPLADDPAVQRAVSEQITDEIFSRIDVAGLTAEAVTALSAQLPPAVATQLQALAGTLATGVRNVVGDQVAALVASDVFASAWTEANRAAHEQLVATLSGDTSSVDIEGTTVTVQLATFAEAVKQSLIERGFGLAERIPQINAEFVIMQSDDLPKIQSAYNLLDALGLWLPIVCMVLLLLGVYVARNHRRAAIAACLGVAAAMLFVGLVLNVGRIGYLNAVPAETLPADAAAVIYDTVVGFLREGIRAIGLLALVIAIGALLIGPSVTATHIRHLKDAAARATARGLNSLGVPMNKAAHAMRPLHKGLIIGAVVLALAAFVAPAYPTPQLVLRLTATLLIVLFVLAVSVSGVPEELVTKDEVDAGTALFSPGSVVPGMASTEVAAPVVDPPQPEGEEEVQDASPTKPVQTVGMSGGSEPVAEAVAEVPPQK